MKQIDLKDQYFGTEIEMTGISRYDAAVAIGRMFGTEPYHIRSYDSWCVKDSDGKTWKFSRDSSIDCERLANGTVIDADGDYSTEMVSPKLEYSEMGKLQEVVRCVKNAGAFVNSSCGMHVHVDASNHTPRSLKNALTIMYCKEDILFKALNVQTRREDEYCQKVRPMVLEKIRRMPNSTITMEKFKRAWYEGNDGSSEHYNWTRYYAVGVKKSIRSKSFKGYLKEEEHKARAAKKDEIVEILKACTNIRDRLLMLLLAETGYRIGEILGIDYSKDIDYQNHIIRVYFREDNENGARAKNAEYRSAKISKDTFGFLNLYIAEYRKLLQHQTSLFVNISGDNIGKPMNVEAVYSMLKRMDKKTGIKITPHMLRHYFGNERRKAGWSLELIQLAYGHRHIQTTINYLDIVDDELLDASQEFYEKHSSLYGIEELL